MSIIFEELGKKEFTTAIDASGFDHIKVPVPADKIECWACQCAIQPMDRHCWYSIAESCLYCQNCVTEPTTGP